MMKYEKIGNKEDLILVGVRDASYKQDDKAIEVIFLFLSNLSVTVAKKERLNLLKMVDDLVLASRQ